MTTRLFLRYTLHTKIENPAAGIRACRCPLYMFKVPLESALHVVVHGPNRDENFELTIGWDLCVFRIRSLTRPYSVFRCILRCLYRILVGDCAALSACFSRLAFLMRVCLQWFPAQTSSCLCILHHRVSLKYQKVFMHLRYVESRWREKILVGRCAAHRK